MINDMLRKLRSDKCLSQQEVADYLKVKRPTYTRYESGTNEPDLNTVSRLADFFNVTVDFLLERNITEQKETAPVVDERTEKNVATIMELVSQLSEEQLDAVITIMKNMVK